MRIKNPESTFKAYNFWSAEDTEELQTSLESYMTQLSNGVCGFSASSADRKLLEHKRGHKRIQLTTHPRGFEVF